MTIEILGNDRRVIRRLQGYGREVSGYQIGLMEAIKCRPGTVFDRSRYTNAGFVGVGIFLFIFVAFACGGFNVVPKAGKKEARHHGHKILLVNLIRMDYEDEL